MATTTHAVSTRLVKGGAEHKTDLTLDWDGVSQADLLEYAGRTVVISFQRVERESGKIRPKVALKVKEFMDGKGRPEKVITPEKVLAAAEKMDPKAVEALIASLKKQVSGAVNPPAKPGKQA